MKQEDKDRARFPSWGKLCYQKCLALPSGHYKSKRKAIQNKAGKIISEMTTKGLKAEGF